jgi:hypothetical protein
MRSNLGVAFWLCVIVAVYPYVVYPVLLTALNWLRRKPRPLPDPQHVPTITVICPVHNQAVAVGERVRNLMATDYPMDRLQVLVVGDGCTDDSLRQAQAAGPVEVIDLPRAGKARALNAGLSRARGEVVAFTDAGIRTEVHTLRALAAHFSDPDVGCVSGEDRIEDGSGEGLYGRLEIRLRRQEARLHSIAGASGCLYAVRRSDCRPFRPGMAPDFLSVLDVVRAGKRAVCEPAARGYMKSTSSLRGEFSRKRRTILRGITALFGNASLMCPFRHPAFSFILVSHKLVRWFGPIALAGALITSGLMQHQQVYHAAFMFQVALYVLAATGLALPALAARSTLLKICAFFVMVNAAAGAALLGWLVGQRQEIWDPTRRAA